MSYFTNSELLNVSPRQKMPSSCPTFSVLRGEGGALLRGCPCSAENANMPKFPPLFVPSVLYCRALLLTVGLSINNTLLTSMLGCKVSATGLSQFIASFMIDKTCENFSSENIDIFYEFVKI